jgi:hypothetical protein
MFVHLSEPVISEPLRLIVLVSTPSRVVRRERSLKKGKKEAPWFYCLVSRCMWSRVEHVESIDGIRSSKSQASQLHSMRRAAKNYNVF